MVRESKWVKKRIENKKDQWKLRKVEAIRWKRIGVIAARKWYERDGRMRGRKIK